MTDNVPIYYFYFVEFIWKQASQLLLLMLFREKEKQQQLTLFGALLNQTMNKTKTIVVFESLPHMKLAIR